MLNSTVLAGFGKQTHLHAIGDGATWIAEQVKNKFGSQGSYLVDFYHVCEYLAAAAPFCTNDDDVENWLNKQKK